MTAEIPGRFRAGDAAGNDAAGVGMDSGSGAGAPAMYPLEDGYELGGCTSQFRCLRDYRHLAPAKSHVVLCKAEGDRLAHCVCLAAARWCFVNETRTGKRTRSLRASWDYPASRSCTCCSRQSSTSSPETRRNSPTLLVTAISRCARAVPAINASKGPIGVPPRERSARSRPVSRASLSPHGRMATRASRSATTGRIILARAGSRVRPYSTSMMVMADTASSSGRALRRRAWTAGCPRTKSLMTVVSRRYFTTVGRKGRRKDLPVELTAPFGLARTAENLALPSNPAPTPAILPRQIDAPAMPRSLPG